MDKYFIYYDEACMSLPYHEVKVLVRNNDFDRTYSLIDVPININGSLNEYQNRVGRIVYLLHKYEDGEFIENYSSIVKRLEGEENRYNIVKSYGKGNVDVKESSVGFILPDLNKEYVIYNNLYKLSYNDEIYVLKQNDDESVSVHKAPLFRKKKYLQYQIGDNSFFVVACKEGKKYNKDDIFKLESTYEENKYNMVKLYETKKVKVKKASF